VKIVGFLLTFFGVDANLVGREKSYMVDFLFKMGSLSEGLCRDAPENP